MAYDAPTSSPRAARPPSYTNTTHAHTTSRPHHTHVPLESLCDSINELITHTLTRHPRPRLHHSHAPREHHPAPAVEPIFGVLLRSQARTTAPPTLALSNRSSSSGQFLRRPVRRLLQRLIFGVVKFSSHRNCNPGGHRDRNVWGSPLGPSAQGRFRMGYLTLEDGGKPLSRWSCEKKGFRDLRSDVGQ